MQKWWLNVGCPRRVLPKWDSVYSSRRPDKEPHDIKAKRKGTSKTSLIPRFFKYYYGILWIFWVIWFDLGRRLLSAQRDLGYHSKEETYTLKAWPLNVAPFSDLSRYKYEFYCYFKEKRKKLVFLVFESLFPNAGWWYLGGHLGVNNKINIFIVLIVMFSKGIVNLG